MEILHLFRSRGEATGDAEAVVKAQGAEHSTRILFLEDRPDSPEGFDRELFQAIRHADRVVSW